MTDAPAPTPAPTVDLATVELDVPIVRGETTIGTLKIRKPHGGELRGLSLIDVVRLQDEVLRKLVPRITIPPLIPEEVDALDPADRMAIAAEIGTFFVPASTRKTLTTQ